MTRVNSSIDSSLRLTQFALGGGCACKLPPGELEALVSELSADESSDLIVGLASGDDAAVVRLDGDRAIIVTTDFFTPVVDDPYDWGRIAAANAARPSASASRASPSGSHLRKAGRPFSVTWKVAPVSPPPSASTRQCRTDTPCRAARAS